MVTEETIREVLGTIDDPEMPISIVDLGIVHSVGIEPVGPEGGAGVQVGIDLLPTFVGCPALPAIEQEVHSRVGALPGVRRIEVRFLFDPPWTVDRVSPAGRERLRQMGVTVPLQSPPVPAETAAPRCPFCGSGAVRLESSFGPTRCRMIYYCESCRNPFEHLKRVGGQVHLATINPRGNHGD
jgi:ring-1,2-phenylacetyl-CoA epoxidase subunit PaaD